MLIKNERREDKPGFLLIGIILIFAAHKIRMKGFLSKVLAISLLGIQACQEGAAGRILVKNNLGDYNGRSLQFGKVINLSAEGKDIDSMRVYLNGIVQPDSFEISKENSHYGTNQLKLVVYYNDAESVERRATFTVLPDNAPITQSYQVRATYPHNTENFTEGLIYHDGIIYESTGLRGASKLEVYDLLTGKVKQVKKLDSKYFGEGIAKVGDSIYQLTYKAQKVFVYDTESMEQIGEFSFPFSNEGWGLCYDGRYLIMSNGSHELYFIDPKDFSLQHTMEIVDNNGIRKNLNELEFYRGRIYANVWYENEILVIDAASGVVEEVLQIPEIPEGLGRDDVANGIAIKDGNLLITGKNWPVIFELSLAEKEF